ncbi:MAG: restriction endonuclease, partial [Nitrososphaerales archaeon]
FSIALISFIVAIVVRERGYGSEVEAGEKTGTDEPVPSVEEASTKGVWTPQQLQKWKRKDFGRADRFSALPTSDFRDLVSELFRRMDYSVERSLYHADFGIDLIARKEKEVVSIEAKKWKQGRDVGTEIVRRAVEGRWKCGASKAIIITTSGFTPKAKVLAKKSPIELWDYQQLNSLIEKYFVG